MVFNYLSIAFTSIVTVLAGNRLPDPLGYSLNNMIIIHAGRILHVFYFGLSG